MTLIQAGRMGTTRVLDRPHGHCLPSCASCRRKGGKRHHKGTETQRILFECNGLPLCLRVSVVTLPRAAIQNRTSGHACASQEPRHPGFPHVRWNATDRKDFNTEVAENHEAARRVRGPRRHASRHTLEPEACMAARIVPPCPFAVLRDFRGEAWRCRTRFAAHPSRHQPGDSP